MKGVVRNGFAVFEDSPNRPPLGFFESEEEAIRVAKEHTGKANDTTPEPFSPKTLLVIACKQVT